MGRVNSYRSHTGYKSMITHFGHPHSLHFFGSRMQTLQNPPICSACNLRISEMVYVCIICRYFVHQACLQMPEKIIHQSHHHQLKVALSPPYHNRLFSCDICHKTGSNQWLYRCSHCDFDAHLKCATAVPVVLRQESVGAQSAETSLLSANSFDSRVNADLVGLIDLGTTRNVSQLVNLNFEESQLVDLNFEQTSNDNSSYDMILQSLSSPVGVDFESQLQGLMDSVGNINFESQLQGLMDSTGSISQLQGLTGGIANQLQGSMGSAGGVSIASQQLEGQTSISGVGIASQLQELMGSTGDMGIASQLQRLMGTIGGAGRTSQELVGNSASGVGIASPLQEQMGNYADIASHFQGLTTSGGRIGNPLQTGVDLQTSMTVNSNGANMLPVIGSTGGPGTAELLQSFIGDGGAGLFQRFTGGS